MRPITGIEKGAKFDTFLDQYRCGNPNWEGVLCTVMCLAHILRAFDKPRQLEKPLYDMGGRLPGS